MVIWINTLATIFWIVDTDAKNIEAIPKADFLEFYRRYISPKSQHQKKFSLHVRAQGADVPENTAELTKAIEARNMIVGDLVEFKSMMQLGPAPRPVAGLETYAMKYKQRKAKL